VVDAGGGGDRADELQRARAAAEAAEAVLSAQEREVEARAEEEANLAAQLEDLRAEAASHAAAQAEESKHLDRLLTRRNVVAHKLEEHAAAIRTLGSLPRDAANEVDPSLSSRALLDQVDKVNQKLRKYQHVNKKALSQSANFAEQREQLLERKEAVDKGAEAIRDLIRHLDAQKDEALERTFKDVARHFEAVFKELVPAGSGQLVMVEAPRAGAADPDAPEDAMDVDADGVAGATGGSGTTDADAAAHMKYSGVSIRVRFAGGGDTQSMQQLSGGQKTMVALCLIFAIQRCAPHRRPPTRHARPRAAWVVY